MRKKTRRYIILGRDGVINQYSGQPIISVSEWTPVAGSLEAMALLRQHDYRLIILTNQPGLGRRLFDIDTLHAIHGKLIARLAPLGVSLTAIFFCPHTPREKCPCRKPQTGLYERLVQRLHIDLGQTPCVGSKPSDIQAAVAAGGQPILVRSAQDAPSGQPDWLPEQVPVFDDLAAVARQLCAE